MRSAVLRAEGDFECGLEKGCEERLEETEWRRVVGKGGAAAESR